MVSRSALAFATLCGSVASFGQLPDVNRFTPDALPRAAMDFAAAAKNDTALALLKKAGGRGLCTKGDRGGFARR